MNDHHMLCAPAFHGHFTVKHFIDIISVHRYRYLWMHHIIELFKCSQRCQTAVVADMSGHVEIHPGRVTRAFPRSCAICKRGIGEALARVAQIYSIPSYLRHHRGIIGVDTASRIVRGSRNFIEFESVSLPKPHIKHQFLVVVSRAQLAVEVSPQPFLKLRESLSFLVIIGHACEHSITDRRHIRSGIEGAGNVSVAGVSTGDVLHIYVILGYARWRRIVIDVPHVQVVCGVAH